MVRFDSLMLLDSFSVMRGGVEPRLCGSTSERELQNLGRVCATTPTHAVARRRRLRAAARRACAESAFLDAVRCGSRFNARKVAASASWTSSVVRPADLRDTPVRRFCVCAPTPDLFPAA
jgi:hypothetical protein